MSDQNQITVLQGQAHGIPIAEYAEVLRDRLPEWDVRHAKTSSQERDLVADAPIVTGSNIKDVPSPFAVSSSMDTIKRS